MANCNKLFGDYNRKITPTKEERQKMKKSREAVEKKVTAKIREKLGMTPTYYTQGSSAKDMRTLIIKEDGTYDADRGVYLPSKPNVSAETVQRYVYDAVKDHTEDSAEHRKKCIRVFYRSAYNIDLPIYYEVKEEDFSYMAVKGEGWIKDDPWHMIKWLEKHKDSNGQLVRIIKYLKVWSSNCKGKMPSGIALAVWAANNFVAKENRDDEALYETLKAISNSIKDGIVCCSPVEPFDDFLSKLSDDQKNNFRTLLNQLVNDADKALKEPNELKSSNLWRNHLGSRFPVGNDEDTDAKFTSLNSVSQTILALNAKLDSSGKINTASGVQHKVHRNYGS